LSERRIISRIKEEFPRHAILSEESGESGQKEDTILWIIDPLDGTVNFAYGIPIFSVSIAVAFQNTLLCGVVYAPILNELFIAEKGCGAYLNGKKISCSKTSLLSDAHLAFGMPYHTYKKHPALFSQIDAIGKLGVPLRRLGSAAIDLSYVACGRFDGFWEPFLQPWDYAAGKLIIEEAGGILTHFNGEPIKMLQECEIVATNSFIHKQFLQHLNVI
jgi:myo-inositol-1(or 4)-monophosphatase